MADCTTVQTGEIELDVKCNESLIEFAVEIYSGDTCTFKVSLDNASCDFKFDDVIIEFSVRRTPQSRNVIHLDDSLGGGIRRVNDNMFDFEFDLPSEITGIPAMEYLFYITMKEEGVFVNQCKTVAKGTFTVLPSGCA